MSYTTKHVLPNFSEDLMNIFGDHGHHTDNSESQGIWDNDRMHTYHPTNTINAKVCEYGALVTSSNSPPLPEYHQQPIMLNEAIGADKSGVQISRLVENEGKIGKRAPLTALHTYK
ncbi:jg22869 [Pararge aegeria aegeria]|uniref:Jg22869 protein n=1 Tax=Pararge aegeria aegeria TaxID=348720 RepID=A0A8S4QVZ2_9NEOP|nr:jg22869 [Pararge aegeria aegeria]